MKKPDVFVQTTGYYHVAGRDYADNYPYEESLMSTFKNLGYTVLGFVPHREKVSKACPADDLIQEEFGVNISEKETKDITLRKDISLEEQAAIIGEKVYKYNKQINMHALFASAGLDYKKVIPKRLTLFYEF